VLLIDETSLRRGHRYVTVLINGDTGQTLGIVAHRNQAALSGFLLAQGHRWLRGVKVVVSDGSGYAETAEVTNTRLGTIRSRIARARAELVSLLQEQRTAHNRDTSP
jgi:transposase